MILFYQMYIFLLYFISVIQNRYKNKYTLTFFKNNNIKDKELTIYIL